MLQRKSLMEEFNVAKDPMDRLEIHRKIQGLQETLLKSSKE